MTKLLHGVLHATIHNIDKLHVGCELPLLFEDPKRVWRTLLYRAKACCSCNPELIGYRLYTTVDLDKARVARTKIITTPSNPQWSQSFRIYCAHEVSKIIFTIKDENPVSATLIGRARLPVEEVIQGRPVDRWLEIYDESGKYIRSRIHVSVHFMDVTRDPTWSRGILNNPKYGGVPSTFFRQRQGCKVSLYQDAHVSDIFTPQFVLSSGEKYEPRRCWEDVFDAIVNARNLIYIAGWSVNTNITLIRDPRRPKGEDDLHRLTLGELLIKKANEEGLRVLVLVWDDITSNVYNKQGLMATHDETTLSFFENTKVQCFKCPRRADQGTTNVQGFQADTMFTHHQKTIVVDSEIPGTQKRVIMSFLGGIDLCDGRYDTQDHPLFRTLGTVHKDDFHQPNFPNASIKKGGPRESWHDIHCRLEGPVAWDVLYNFEQRWKKQVGKKFLYSIRELKAMLANPSQVVAAAEQETWDVQIFRSIDGGSVIVDGEPGSGFPSGPKEAGYAGLVCDKGNIIDRSIQDGYINAIRRAKNFIYIENQYFLGSSYAWKPEENVDVDALHLIPKELSLKIVSKIKAGERFSVYVVIPMWPEGEPESGSVQAILYWQRRTMEMMYADIAAAIQSVRLNAHPRDYLSFFCLGNREVFKQGEYEPPEKPEPDSNYSKAQHNRRFMIYVHAKMMIVDDEYIIIGSANINQRSMDGGRDTEIAMGGYQPHYLSAGPGRSAKGQIFGFRMALWYEHLHQIHKSFLYPEKLECMQKVNELAEVNWIVYTSEAFDQDLPGHILPYPIQVSNFGHVTELSDAEKYFPDTKAPVLGAKSELLPPILTT